METFSRETELDPEFITGFCEAAATFTFSRSGKQLSLYFALKLPARDRALLERLQDFFAGAGTIYELSPRGAAYYRIARVRELGAVVDHFDSHPFQGHKAQVFRLWREMVLHKVETGRKADREHLERLATQLSAALRGSAHPRDVESPAIAPGQKPDTRFEPEID